MFEGKKVYWSSILMLFVLLKQVIIELYVTDTGTPVKVTTKMK